MLDFALEQLIAEEDSLDPIGDEFEQHNRYLDRCRRVRVGPSVVVVFENARTLRLRLRELARVARLTDPARIHRAMNWYESLLPGRGRLLASVSVRAAAREIVSTLDYGAIELRVGSHVVPGVLRRDAAGDRVVGLIRWAEFAVFPAARAAFGDEAQPLTLGIDVGAYSHESEPLAAAVRASLLGDLIPPRM